MDAAKTGTLCLRTFPCSMHALCNVHLTGLLCTHSIRLVETQQWCAGCSPGAQGRVPTWGSRAGAHLELKGGCRHAAQGRVSTRSSRAGAHQEPKGGCPPGAQGRACGGREQGCPAAKCASSPPGTRESSLPAGAPCLPQPPPPPTVPLHSPSPCTESMD